jgi:hypothetical protein
MSKNIEDPSNRSKIALDICPIEIKNIFVGDDEIDTVHASGLKPQLLQDSNELYVIRILLLGVALDKHHTR